MRETARAAVDAGVAIGAHPGYTDPQGFGRRELGLAAPAIGTLVQAQCATLADAVAPIGASLQHVKLHGALYHRASTDAEVAAAVASAVSGVDPALIVVGLPGSALEHACRERDLSYAREAFADRGYAGDGHLLPRQAPGGLVTGAAIAERAVRMAVRDEVLLMDGTALPLAFETLCLHGDTPDAASSAAGVRRGLEAAGVTVAAMSRVIRR